MKYFKICFAFLILFTSYFTPAHAATLSFQSSGEAHVGDTVVVPIVLTTAPGEAANAVSATVSVPSDMLAVKSISKAGSIITLWPQDPVVNATGVHFEGIILNPGWSGINGVVATIEFTALQPGDALLTFADAKVLANDGQGSNILTGAFPKTITIDAAAAQSTTQAKPIVKVAPVAPAKPKETIASSTMPTPTLATTSTTTEPIVVTAAPVSTIVNNACDAATCLSYPAATLLLCLLVGVLLLLLILIWRLVSLRKNTKFRGYDHSQAFVLDELESLRHLIEKAGHHRALTKEEQVIVEQLKLQIKRFKRDTK